MPSSYGPDIMKMEVVAGWAVVRLIRNHLDESNAETVSEQLFRMAEEMNNPRLLLDLTKVEFISSVGLCKFVALHGKLRQAGGRLSLCNVHARVYELFMVMNLHKVLEIRKAAG